MNLSLPKFVNLRKELRIVAQRIIITDINDRMEKEVDLRGRAYPPLAPITVELKRRYGLHTEILFARGKLRRSFDIANYGRSGVRIFIRGDRRKVANILQNIGVKSKAHGLRKFLFFGISEEAEEDTMKFMRQYIDREIEIGRRKVIR